VHRRNIYEAIKSINEIHGFSICLLCKIIGIARSAYYKWLNKVPTKRELENQNIMEEMVRLYNEVDGIYGYRRLKMNLNRKLQKPYNHKRIYRLMKLLGLKSVIRKKKKRYIRSTHQHVYENILNREFKSSKPNLKWVTDVTEFKYGNNKKAYLSAILDLYDNSIISYVLGHRNDNQLVFKTLDIALKAYPNAKPMLHSDRGFQYTSKGFKRKIDKAQMTQSMSRVARCIDNGPMEGFWGIIKSEKYNLNKYDTFEQLQKSVDDYIHFYNYKRLQKRLNSLSPVEFRTSAA